MSLFPVCRGTPLLSLEPNFCGEEGYVGISPFVVTPRKDSYAPVKKVEGFTEFSKVIGSSFFLAGCAAPPLREGGLNEPCYPNGTCDEGFECLEDICVVGETVSDGGIAVDNGHAVDGGSPVDNRGDAGMQPDGGSVVDGESPVSGIAVGQYHTCAIKQDGTAWCWGRNGFGQVGNGTTVNYSRPVQVARLTSSVSISAGESHTCVVEEDGTARCWGLNTSGQIGNGESGTTSIRPVPVANLSQTSGISAGDRHTCAAKRDGTAWCWGKNSFGQIGDGTIMNRPLPVRVANLNNVLSVGAGLDHTCAVKRDGTVWCWGYNGYGQIGDGTNTDRLAPARVAGLGDIVSLDTGMFHTCALQQGGTAWAWGYNWHGQLGDGTGHGAIARWGPVQVENLSAVVSLVSGATYTCAVKQDGTAWCWGDNRTGQIRDGTDTEHFLPVRVANLTDVVIISAGYYHTCAVQRDGTTWCWGANDFGQLGNGTTEKASVPIQVRW